jgi:HTH-type transcriptional regulator/antitoxin HigA
MESFNFADLVNQSVKGVHPGEILAGQLSDNGLSQKELASLIGKSTPVINDIIKGRRDINAEIAVLLENVFSLKAEEWMKYQVAYDIDKMRNSDEVKEQASCIKDWNVIKEEVNMTQMKKDVTFTGRLKEDIKAIYDYADVSGIDEFTQLSTSKKKCFKKSMKLQTDEHNLFTWVLRARHLSKTQPALATAFDPRKSQELENKLNNLIYYNKVDVEQQVEKTLNEYGIHYVSLEHLPKVPLDGYAFWKGANPTIVLTKRHNKIDNYAFSLMHELGHVNLHLVNDHDGDFIDIEKETPSIDKEAEANEFAQKALSRGHAEDLLALYKKLKNPYVASKVFTNLAPRIGINPSILAGQYQHYRGAYSICRDIIQHIAEN